MKLKKRDSRRLTIAGITGILGLVLGVSAVAIGGLGLALLWPAASLGFISAGYIFLGPLVCGKLILAGWLLLTCQSNFPDSP